MNIYSDILTNEDILRTVGEVPGMYIESIRNLIRPKIRSRGWEVVTASYMRKRLKNGGNCGSSELNAASYDDHGFWFAKLYEIDPDAQIVYYKNCEDFEIKTKGKYNTITSGEERASV